MVKEDGGAFALTAGGLAVEVMAVTRAVMWMEAKIHIKACSQSFIDYTQEESGLFVLESLASLRRSGLTKICFIIVPGQMAVKGNEWHGHRGPG